MFKLRYENMNRPFWVQSCEMMNTLYQYKIRLGMHRAMYLQGEALGFLDIQIPEAGIQAQRIEVIKNAQINQFFP